MLTQTRIPILDLLDGYEAALTKMGYSLTTKLLFLKRADLMIRRHLNKGLEYLDSDIIIDYTQEIDERYFNGGMKRRYHERARREIERFVNYACSGNSEMQPSPLRGARQKLLPAFEQITEEFLSGKFHPNTRCDMRWAIHKYFAWLAEQGYENLNAIGAVQLQKFLLYCSELYAPSSIHDIRIYLKKLYAFLYVPGQSETDYCELLSFSVNREKKVFPSIPKSDIAKLLDAIDRTSVKGKRNYAVMMLGTVLGLRACDVAALKLTDIDWLHGEVRVLQSKTSNLVSLPLTQDVGEALQDYILNARPNSGKRDFSPYQSAAHSACCCGDDWRNLCRMLCRRRVACE